MNKEYISICKMFNLLFVVLLTMCASPEFFYGQDYNQLLVVLGVIGYGLTLRWVGTDVDKRVGIS